MSFEASYTQLVPLNVVLGHPARQTNIPGILSFNPRQPFEIALTFKPPSNVDVTWFISRDVLDDATEGNVGDINGSGDITVHTLDVRIRIAFSSHEGLFFTHINRALLRGFLARTKGAVPRGQETVDVDSWIAEILAAAETAE
jgi:hypothetical protein